MTDKPNKFLVVPKDFIFNVEEKLVSKDIKENVNHKGDGG